ncbi:MAG: carbohydrate ABC transporter permease [Acidimicrobiaceae bacterium]|nr:carbohydrate ABC transporter permease [Acidimicrobiaceae bacterium]
MARSDTTSEAVRPVPLLERDAVRLWIRRIRLTVSYALLVFFALMFIMPFVLAAISSFKTLPDIAQNPTGLGFDGGLGSPTFDGVERLNRERIRIPRWALNSTIQTVSVTLGRLVLATMAGFALSRLRFRGRWLIFGAIIAVQAIPGIVLVIPKFLVMKQLGILNTYWGLILPLMFDAFAIFIMKGFFDQVPHEIEEAAAIDGATLWQTYSRILLPLVSPGLIALTVLSVQGTWNEFLHSLLAAPSNADIRTLPVGLALLRGAFGQNNPWNTLMAASLLTTIPMAIVFFTFQRYFREGLAAAAVKG